MNERGREALRAAALAGVEQIRESRLQRAVVQLTLEQLLPPRVEPYTFQPMGGEDKPTRRIPLPPDPASDSGCQVFLRTEGRLCETGGEAFLVPAPRWSKELGVWVPIGLLLVPVLCKEHREVLAS
jgi:hypothetical protein